MKCTMTRKQRKSGRLDQDLEEVGRALHRLGAPTDEAYAKITMRNKIDHPRSPTSH
jgi:hypothetical protein